MLAAMEWICDDLDRDAWSSLARDAPLEQAWAYGEVASGLGARVRRLHLVQGGRVVALAQGIERGLGPLRCLWMPRGVHVLEPGAEPDLTHLRAILPRGTFLLSPEEGIALGRMPPRAEVALHERMRESLAKKWRNRLLAAERADLVVRHHSGCSEWLLFEEGRQRRARGYRALPPLWLRRMADVDPAAVQTWIAWQGGRRIAGITCLRSGTQMRYHIGYSSEAGRSVSAHNLLIWRAMCAGYEAGAALLDLGCIDAARLPGLTRFKLGTGAREIPASKIRVTRGWNARAARARRRAPVAAGGAQAPE